MYQKRKFKSVKFSFLSRKKVPNRFYLLKKRVAGLEWKVEPPKSNFVRYRSKKFPVLYRKQSLICVRDWSKVSKRVHLLRKELLKRIDVKNRDLVVLRRFSFSFDDLLNWLSVHGLKKKVSVYLKSYWSLLRNRELRIDGEEKKIQIVPLYFEWKRLCRRKEKLAKLVLVYRLLMKLSRKVSKMQFNLTLKSWRKEDKPSKVYWLKREREKERRLRVMYKLFLKWFRVFSYEEACVFLEEFEVQKEHFFNLFRFPIFDEFPLEGAKVNKSWLNEFFQVLSDMKKKLVLPSVLESSEKASLEGEFSVEKIVSHWITFKVTQNNSFLTAINGKGEVLLWQSAGLSGFKGPRRTTPYACLVTGRKFGYRLLNSLKRAGKNNQAVVFGLMMKEGLRRKAKMMLNGFFEVLRRTRFARRARRYPDLRIKCLIRKEKVSHNGLRKRKRRRV